MPYQYPASDLDRPEALQAEVGSFWSNVFTADDQVAELLAGAAQLYKQTELDFAELQAAVSRFKTAIYHRDQWYLLRLRESGRNTGYSGLLQYLYANPEVYSVGTANHYGSPFQQTTSNWDIPSELHQAYVMVNRLTSPSRVLIQNLDFELSPGAVQFRTNPFADSAFLIRDILKANEIVDRELDLWVFRGQFDWDYVYEQWGHLLQLELPSSQAYLDYVNIILDALVEGTTTRHLRRALSLLTGIPLIRETTETVEDLIEHPQLKQVLTDRHVYTFSPTATFAVSVGDQLQGGDSMVADLQFYEFNRGQAPTPAQVASLATGREFLRSGYFADIVWDNQLVDLVVEEEVDGKTKLSWDLSGWPGDAEQFFDDLHAKGVAAGATLANYLDQRANPEGEPNASHLPRQFNPFELLVQNLFRKFTVLVTINTAGLSSDQLGLHAGRVLRKIIPPQTALIIQIRLANSEGPVRMGSIGQTPGYSETRTLFLGEYLTEQMTSDRIAETVKLRRIRGACY